MSYSEKIRELKEKISELNIKKSNYKTYFFNINKFKNIYPVIASSSFIVSAFLCTIIGESGEYIIVLSGISSGLSVLITKSKELMEIDFNKILSNKNVNIEKEISNLKKELLELELNYLNEMYNNKLDEKNKKLSKN